MTSASGARAVAPARRGSIGSFLPTTRLAMGLLLPMPILLLGAGSPVAVGVVVAADAVLILAALVEAWRLPAAADLRLRRIHRPVLSLGTEVDLACELTLRADAPPRPVTASLRDDFPPSLEPVARPGPLAISAGVPALFPVTVVPRQRGRHEHGPVHVRLSGALGLAQRQYAFEAPGEFRILPSLAGLARYRMLAVRGRMREAGLRHLRLRGAGSSFESLREHLPGEDVRRMDWKATARRNRLIARNYEVERSRSVMLMVDAGRLMTAETGGGFSRLENALHAALILAHVAVVREDRVGALAFADALQGFAPADRGRGALERVTSVLSDVEGRLVEPDVEGAFLHLASRGRKRSLLVLFTEVVDPEISRAILAHVSRAATRHQALVVTQRDGGLERLARGEGSPDPYRRAAAEEFLHHREQAILALRRRGVSVLDVPPDALTASLVERYLELKQR